MTFSLKISPTLVVGLFRSLHFMRSIEFAFFLEGPQMGFDTTHPRASQQSTKWSSRAALMLTRIIVVIALLTCNSNAGSH
jgi:hypothetical protein